MDGRPHYPCLVPKSLEGEQLQGEIWVRALHPVVWSYDPASSSVFSALNKTYKQETVIVWSHSKVSMETFE